MRVLALLFVLGGTACGPAPLQRLGKVMVAPHLSNGEVSVHFLDEVAGCRIPAGVQLKVNGVELREPYPGAGSWPSCAPASWHLPANFVADRLALELTDGESSWVADYGSPQLAPVGTLTSARDGVLSTGQPMTLLLDPMPVVPALGAIQLDVVDGGLTLLFRRFLVRRGDAFVGEPGSGTPGRPGVGVVELNYTREVEAARCEGFSECLQVRAGIKTTLGVVRVDP